MAACVLLLAAPSAPGPVESALRTGLAGQNLPLKRELPPPSDPTACEGLEPTVPGEDPGAEARREAEELRGEAARAMILGDAARAAELLERAAGLDPGSLEIRFALARALEESGERQAAFDAFCRYLALDPDGPDRAEARSRLEQLAPPDPIPPAARRAFHAGIERFEGEAYDEAVREFSRALVELPNWSHAHYNRGVAYLRAGREGAGLSDLEQYLELTPDDEDAARVRRRLQAAAPALPSPGTAFAVGVLMPGMGHFYGGRAGWGTVYLLGAGAGAAAGLLYREVEVRCRTIPGPDGCPSEHIAEERETQPLLVPGLAAAAGLTLIGAIHAYLDLRGRRSGAGMALGLELTGPRGTAVALDPLPAPGGAALRARVRISFP